MIDMRQNKTGPGHYDLQNISWLCQKGVIFFLVADKVLQFLLKNYNRLIILKTND